MYGAVRAAWNHPFDKTAHNNGISIINSTRSTGISTAAEQQQHEDKRADKEEPEEEHADIRPHVTMTTKQDEPELEDNEDEEEKEQDDPRLSYWAMTTGVKSIGISTAAEQEQHEDKRADKEEPEEEHADIRPHATMTTKQDKPELEDNEDEEEKEHDDPRLSYWAMTTGVKSIGISTAAEQEHHEDKRADKEEPEEDHADIRPHATMTTKQDEPGTRRQRR